MSMMPRDHVPQRPSCRDPLIGPPTRPGLVWGAGDTDGNVNARVNRRIDVALLPLLSLLYLFNGLDRSNIGNAQTQGRTLHHHTPLPPGKAS